MVCYDPFAYETCEHPYPIDQRKDGVKRLPAKALEAGGKIVAYFDDLLRRRAAPPGWRAYTPGTSAASAACR